MPPNRNFLSTLNAYRLGIKANLASPNKKMASIGLSLEDISRRLVSLENGIKSTTIVEKYFGKLVAADVERNLFSLKTVDNILISGKISSSLLNSVYSVPQNVSVEVELKSDFNPVTQEEKDHYTLLKITPIIDDLSNCEVVSKEAADTEVIDGLERNKGDGKDSA